MLLEWTHSKNNYQIKSASHEIDSGKAELFNWLVYYVFNLIINIRKGLHDDFLPNWQPISARFGCTPARPAIAGCCCYTNLECSLCSAVRRAPHLAKKADWANERGAWCQVGRRAGGVWRRHTRTHARTNSQITNRGQVTSVFFPPPAGRIVAFLPPRGGLKSVAWTE